MVKHCLVWKDVKNVVGEPVRLSVPEIAANYYHGTLVAQIQAMPRKQPMSFEVAINLIAEKQKEALLAGQVGLKREHYSGITDMNGTISCNSCHNVMAGGEDNRAHSIGVG